MNVQSSQFKQTAPTTSNIRSLVLSATNNFIAELTRTKQDIGVMMATKIVKGFDQALF